MIVPFLFKMCFPTPEKKRRRIEVKCLRCNTQYAKYYYGTKNIKKNDIVINHCGRCHKYRDVVVLNVFYI